MPKLSRQVTPVRSPRRSHLETKPPASRQQDDERDEEDQSDDPEEGETGDRGGGAFDHRGLWRPRVRAVTPGGEGQDAQDEEGNGEEGHGFPFLELEPRASRQPAGHRCADTPNKGKSNWRANPGPLAGGLLHGAAQPPSPWRPPGARGRLAGHLHAEVGAMTGVVLALAGLTAGDGGPGILQCRTVSTITLPL